MNDLGNFMGLALADIDSDGDTDIMSGEDSGRLFLFENQGIFADSGQRMMGSTHILGDSSLLDAMCHPLNSYEYCSPDLSDLDNDGDLDLMVANALNEPYYWRNDGSADAYSFTPIQSVGTALGSWVAHTPTIGDVDGDGDKDVLYSDNQGRSRLTKNIGTPTSPAWESVSRGQDGKRFVPDFGTYQSVSFVDIDADGDDDVFVHATQGAAAESRNRFLKNQGILSSQTKRGDDPTWVNKGTLFTTSGWTNQPTGADFDGDGDMDLLVGDYYNAVSYYTNNGDNTYTFAFQVYYLGNTYGTVAPVDLDGDGAIDFASSNSIGTVDFYRNIGTYQIATTITINNGTPVQNASVVFSDDSGTVCTNTTDTEGKVSCPLQFIGNNAEITITGASGGDIRLSIFSPNSNGKTFMTMENAADNVVIELERFWFETFDLNTDPARMTVKVEDSGTKIFAGETDNTGLLNGFFPKRYLVNKQELFTQNRIMYDITLLGGSIYSSNLELTDVYVPNELRFSADTEGDKMYKFLATHEMGSDAEYRGYIIYPVLTAQRNYNLYDELPGEFSYVGDVMVTYLGEQCNVSGVAGTNISIPYTQSGCEFLTDPVETAGDWISYQFTVSSPDLDFFITGGFNSSDFVIPPATLGLTS